MFNTNCCVTNVNLKRLKCLLVLSFRSSSVALRINRWLSAALKLSNKRESSNNFWRYIYLICDILLRYAIYALNLFIEQSGEHWWEQNIFCSFITPQAFWHSSAPGALSTLVTSVVLYSLTRATVMSPGKDETNVCGYLHLYIYIYIYITYNVTCLRMLHRERVFC